MKNEYQVSERNAIVEDHLWCIDSVIRQNYTLIKAARLDLDDVYQTLALRLIRAVAGYNPEKGILRQHIRVPYACFHAFVIDNDSIDGQSRRLLSIPDTNRPRIAFQRSRNLAAVAGNPLLRHKLGLFLDRHFQWRNCTKIILTDETIPYSFAFQSYTAVGADITGGVILHQQEDLRTAYYSIHT